MYNICNSEYNRPCKTRKSEDGGVYADSDGTDWADSGQGYATANINTFVTLFNIVI